jgi:hypothetical protein
MLYRDTLAEPDKIVYRIVPSSVSAIVVGWLPIDTGVPTVPVSGVTATTEFPVSTVEVELTLAMIFLEYGSKRIWFAPSGTMLNTVSGTACELPPPGDGFDTLIAAQPSVCRFADGTVAVSSVALT